MIRGVTLWAVNSQMDITGARWGLEGEKVPGTYHGIIRVAPTF
jgi:hypothetical protein